MVLFNYSTKELTAKIVYYGPGLCGKTTNLQFVHQNLPDKVRGKMLSLATKTDRTLFFDFLPMDLGDIRGMRTRMQLYTVPGQVFYNETRKLVLKGADGIVFVADSQKEMLGANTEAFKNLEENLKAHGLNLAEMPHVIQFNKRDLPKLCSLEELNASLNRYNAPFYESVATTGIGVHDTLKAITKLVLLHLTRKYEQRSAEAAEPVAAAVPVAAQAPVAAQTPVAAGGGGGRKRGKKRRQHGPAYETATPAQATAQAVDDAPPSVLAASAAATALADVDIDDLVSEVEESRHLEPEPVRSAHEPDLASTYAAEETGLGAGLEPSVTLTDALSDHELFSDPGLEVAQLQAAGEVREIVIPVELLQAGALPGRYKLSIRLRLEPIE
jgi:signal recognition particle receptor subunit beta